MNERIRELALKSGLIQYASDGKMEAVERFTQMLLSEVHDHLERTANDGSLPKKYLDESAEQYKQRLNFFHGWCLGYEGAGETFFEYFELDWIPKDER